jgi:Mn-dependent DtxR family transcriptional regulator
LDCHSKLDPADGLDDKPENLSMQSEIAREILAYLRSTHRLPGARLRITTLDERFGTDPAVAAAVSELARTGYVATPDADTVELTPRGYEALLSNHF